MPVLNEMIVYGASFLFPVAGLVATPVMWFVDASCENELRKVKAKYGWDINAIHNLDRSGSYNMAKADRWVREHGGMAFTVSPALGATWYWKPYDKDFVNYGPECWFGIIRATELTEKPNIWITSVELFRREEGWKSLGKTRTPEGHQITR